MTVLFWILFFLVIALAVHVAMKPRTSSGKNKVHWIVLGLVALVILGALAGIFPLWLLWFLVLLVLIAAICWLAIKTLKTMLVAVLVIAGIVLFATGITGVFQLVDSTMTTASPPTTTPPPTSTPPSSTSPAPASTVPPASTAPASTAPATQADTPIDTDNVKQQVISIANGYPANKIVVTKTPDWTIHTEERGNTWFCNYTSKSPADVAACLRGTDERSKQSYQQFVAALHAKGLDSELQRALDGNGWIAVQFLQAAQVKGNGYFANGKYNVDDKWFTIKAGDVFWLYVDRKGEVVWAAVRRADCNNGGLQAIRPISPTTPPAPAVGTPPETKPQPPAKPPTQEQPPAVPQQPPAPPQTKPQPKPVPAPAPTGKDDTQKTPTSVSNTTGQVQQPPTTSTSSQPQSQPVDQVPTDQVGSPHPADNASSPPPASVPVNCDVNNDGIPDPGCG